MDRVWPDVLEVAENLLDLRARQAKVAGNFALICPRAQQLFDAIGKLPVIRLQAA